MLVSVVLSTYEQPEWLEKALWGYERQTFRDFELIVADDGSSAETAAVIGGRRGAGAFRLRHVWQEDKGFRKCRALNHAIRAARGDYLVFSDGDCIPKGDFLATHAALAAPGRFLSGGYVKLSAEASRRIDRASVDSQRAFSARWLGRGAVPGTGRAAKLWAPSRMRRGADFVTTTRPTWNGHNASAWARDVLAVNGFDERMGYGGEDCEMGERLENLGVRGLRVRYRAICLHLDHARGYADPAVLAKNRVIRRETRRSGATWTPFGIERSPQPPGGAGRGCASPS